MLEENMEINHFSHEHPLVFLDPTAGHEKKRVECSGCGEAIEGSSYRCGSCDFFLHKKCADLPRQINHPLHIQHPLILYTLNRSFECNVCRGGRGFTYCCRSCDFDLDIRCATNSQFSLENLQELQHFSHSHSLIFVQHVSFESKYRKCSGCLHPMSSPFYCCPGCRFYLHKACAEFPREINHPRHHKHLLTLQAKPPAHEQGCSCYMCIESWKGFFYYCFICKFGFKFPDVFDALLQKEVTVEIHDHPLKLFLKTLSFICDACGVSGDPSWFPYTCLECDVMVHRKCLSLRRTIKITRHLHLLNHTYIFPKNEATFRDCRICHDDIDMDYGSYSCLGCNYFVHVKCAIDEYLLEEKYVVQEKDQASEQCAPVRHGDQRKHFLHSHNLIFNDGVAKGDKVCDGCMRPISTSFYYCTQGNFFLHQTCFELLRETRHWTCKHTKTLVEFLWFQCDYCRFTGSGFGYKCNRCLTSMCIWCHQTPDTFKSKRHEHPLFFDHKYGGNCSGCSSKDWRIARRGQFRCKDCNFAVDYHCLAMPDTVEYKNDEHPLVLCTSPDDRDQSQHYCDLCEKKRDPGHWYYYCADCDVSAHPGCVLGIDPFVKLGKPLIAKWVHEHVVTFEKIDFNPPKCKKCKKFVRGVAIRCSEEDCDYIIHLQCVWWYDYEVRDTNRLLCGADEQKEFGGPHII